MAVCHRATAEDTAEADAPVAPPPSANDGRARAGGDGLSVPRDKRIQIIADEANNALLILARGSDYRQILQSEMTWPISILVAARDEEFDGIRQVAEELGMLR